MDWAAVDAAIDTHAEDAFTFLARLVSAASTLGAEAGALDVFAERLTELGLTVRRVPVPPDVGGDPRAGVTQPLDDVARYDVVGTTGPEQGPALLLNGHIDVVPAESPQLWTSPPFQPRREGNRMYGRGAGDMKGGIAMGVLTLQALLETAPEIITGPLSFLAVVEEECTGNGTLAAAADGVLGDAVVLLEPTDLDIVVGAIGVLWCDIDVVGRPAHAQAAHQATNAIDLAMRLVDGLRAWSADLAVRHPDPVLGDTLGLYNLNVGQLTAGDWPSSVPATALLRLRVGFPRSWSPEQAEREVSAAVVGIVAAAGDFPAEPRVRFTGFRAPGYLVDDADPVVRLMADAHESAHGRRPKTLGLTATNDGRIYVEHFGVPALLYGPSASDIHGIDESVDLDTIVAGARTLARFIAGWYALPEGKVAVTEEVT